MIILERELKKIVSIPKNIEELVSLKITEVENFIKEEFVPFDNVCCANVLTCIPHPNSDHMHITTVDTGDGKVIQVVCGAKNIAAGQSVIVAKEGAILPGDFKIAPVKLRGVDSYGMICSLKELGLDKLGLDETDGIYAFEKAVKPGSDYIKELGLDGFFMDISVTPNRGDLLSYYGFAREVAACNNKVFKEEFFNYNMGGVSNNYSVSIDTDKCNYYSLSYLKNVVVKKSPIWLKFFLARNGIAPQNNVVDITNYIMLKYGTPVHVYDADKLSNDFKIEVAEAKKGERVKTLQGKDYTLSGGECVIKDSKQIIALAGIIGLENSKTTIDTKNIVFESATFNSSCIQETSKNLKIETDASARFQRGVSIKMQELAQNEAMYLFTELAGATISKKIIKKTNKKDPKIQIKIELKDINNLLGTLIKLDEVSKIFENLGFNYSLDGEKYLVDVPSYRFDLSIKEDLIEEVARIYGYNNLKGEGAIFDVLDQNTKYLDFESKVKNYLVNKSFYEVITYSLVDEKIKNEHFQGDSIYKLISPITSDHMYLRSKVYPSLLNTYLYNLNRKNENINLFEISNVYKKGKSKRVLSCLLSSSPNLQSHLKRSENNTTFYTLKGILDSLLDKFNLKADYLKTEFTNMHLGMQAEVKIENTSIGNIFKVKPSDDFSNIYIFEIDLEKIYSKLKFEKTTFNEFSKYPDVNRDMAFVISKDVNYLDIENLIKNISGNDLIKLELFDLYNIDDKNYSLAYHLVFNNLDKTLKSEYVQGLINNITKTLEEKIGAKLR